MLALLKLITIIVSIDNILCKYLDLNHFSHQIKKMLKITKEESSISNCLIMFLNLSIYLISKDVLSLKIMLRLLFTPEQYAAVLLCGARFKKKKKQSNQKNLHL